MSIAGKRSWPSPATRRRGGSPGSPAHTPLHAVFPQPPCTASPAKASIFTFAGTAAFFEHHGLPDWAAYPVFALEALAALCFFVGRHTRIAALALTPVMLGALGPHVANGWMFSSPGGGWEYVAFLLAALVTQALLGDRTGSVTARHPTSGSGRYSA